MYGNWAHWLAGLVVMALLAANSVVAQASTPVLAGYRDFNYGTTVNSTPTGEKKRCAKVNGFTNGIYRYTFCVVASGHVNC